MTEELKEYCRMNNKLLAMYMLAHPSDYQKEQELLYYTVELCKKFPNFQELSNKRLQLLLDRHPLPDDTDILKHSDNLQRNAAASGIEEALNKLFGV